MGRPCRNRNARLADSEPADAVVERETRARPAFGDFGDQLMPNRGANELCGVEYGSRLLGEAKSSPPVAENWLAGSCASGFFA